ncbi:alkaline phosphatase family protein [Pedosphaera parvula]|uniref:phospholipase C n=1 Tax=Pedosphaera parvula (strain Ellin514) TaxID=320771 RepID=B9XN31_PEDPL|nr:alkaline phosphatase family protein [Pedosphaera parvula]EEF58693.1 phosphoesterase [Pedosphaera parvula Ellin514]
MAQNRLTNGCPHPSVISRRQFLKTSALLAAGATALQGLACAGSSASPFRLPPPGFSGIEHIVVVMMENRSFDHYLGWLPDADGRQAGLSYPDRDGNLQPTHALSPDDHGCNHPTLDQSYRGGRIKHEHGACNGWLLTGNNDAYALGYYRQRDLAFLGQAAPAWTVCDRYFAPIMAETYPNRIYQHAAQTDRLSDTPEPCSLPTIWDRLAEHDLKGRYYFSDVPFLALWGSKYLSITRTFNRFLEDCAGGALPQVSLVDPRLLGESLDVSGRGNPHTDVHSGEVFLNTVYNAVTTSPNWASTVLIVNFDEGGGFFDHVSPPPAPIPEADKTAGNQDGLRGFRVPALVIAPWSRRGGIAHGVYDHTSILKMIEWRWHLAPLTARDATANNIAEVLDFSRASMIAPRFNVPNASSIASGSTPSAISSSNRWRQLALSAKHSGFPKS